MVDTRSVCGGKYLRIVVRCKDIKDWCIICSWGKDRSLEAIMSFCNAMWIHYYHLLYAHLNVKICSVYHICHINQPCNAQHFLVDCLDNF